MTQDRMTLEKYLAARRTAQGLQRRPSCDRCRKAAVTCYCHLIRPFASPIEFVILQHPREAKNPIATARMAQLTLTNSQVVLGHHFDGNARVEQLLAAPGRRNLLLYPRPDAEPLDEVLEDAAVPGAEPLVLWVIDTKWSYVANMLRRSPAVQRLPATAFTPEKPSTFCVRTQPSKECVSTVEAIHAVLARRAQIARDGDVRHEALLDVFRHLVSQQLGFADRDDDTRHAEAKRKRRLRRAEKNLPEFEW